MATDIKADLPACDGGAQLDSPICAHPDMPEHVHLRVASLRGSGSLTKDQFLLRECRIVAALREQGLSDGAIAYLAECDNIFQYPTTKNAASRARACCRRLDALNSADLVHALAEGEASPEQAAQINLYAMARSYGLVSLFLVEEVGARYRTLDSSFTRVDMNAFFSRLAVQDPVAAAWSESTVARLKGLLRNCLVQAGMLADPSSEELLPVYLDVDLRRIMRENGDTDLLPAFNCMEEVAR